MKRHKSNGRQSAFPTPVVKIGSLGGFSYSVLLGLGGWLALFTLL